MCSVILKRKTEQPINVPFLLIKSETQDSSQSTLDSKTFFHLEGHIPLHVET